jgi:Ca2+-binding EF-hand superfamily protein
MAFLAKPEVDAAFDAFDACGRGEIRVADADRVLKALAVDATRQQVISALQEKSSASRTGNGRVISKDKFYEIVAAVTPAAFSPDDAFAAFSSLDPASTSRVSQSALADVASGPAYLRTDGKAAARAVARWGAYPAKGLSLVEWRALVGTVAPAADNGVRGKKGTKW